MKASRIQVEYFGRDFIEAKMKSTGMLLNGSNYSIPPMFLPLITSSQYGQN